MIRILPLLIACLLAWPARAADEFQAHYERGLARYAEKQYAEAAEAFLHAYEIRPEAGLLFNIGQSYRLLGRPAEALDYYRRYREAAPGLRGKVKRKLDEYIQQCEAELAARAPAPPPAPAPAPDPEPPPAPLLPDPPSPVPDPPKPALAPAAPRPLPAVAITHPPPPPPKKPIYKRWWLWTPLAVAAAGGVAAAVVLTLPPRPGPTDPLSGVPPESRRRLEF